MGFSNDCFWCCFDGFIWGVFWIFCGFWGLEELCIPKDWVFKESFTVSRSIESMGDWEAPFLRFDFEKFKEKVKNLKDFIIVFVLLKSRGIKSDLRLVIVNCIQFEEMLSEVQITQTEEAYFINSFIEHINAQNHAKTQKIIRTSLQIGEEVKDKALMQKISAQRIKKLLHKTQQKMKLGTRTKETRFADFMKPFTQLDSFIDIKGFLHEMNLTNSSNLSGVFDKIKQRLRQKEDGAYYLADEETVTESIEEAQERIKIEEPRVNSQSKPSKPVKKEMKIEMPKRQRLSISLQSVEKKTEIHLPGKTLELSENVLKDFNDRIIKIKTEGNKPLAFRGGSKLLDVKIGDYLLEEAKEPKLQRKTHDFNVTLLTRLQTHELFDDSTEKQHFYKDQERIKKEMQLLQNFLVRNKQEHIFKEEIVKGLYLQAFRNQATKVRQLLDKAAKNIFHKKSKSIDLRSSISPKAHLLPEKFLNLSKEAISPDNLNPMSPKGMSPMEKLSPRKKLKYQGLRVSFGDIGDPFLTAATGISSKNSKQIVKEDSKRESIESIESPMNLNVLKNKIRRGGSLEMAEQMLKDYELNSAKVREDLLKMKHAVLPRLSQNIEFLDKTNVRKFLVAEKNHKDNQRMKRVMSQFIEKVENNIQKNRVEKMEYDGACEKIFEESEKNYEKLFPRVIESIQIHGNEAFDLDRIKKVRMHHKHQSQNYRKKHPKDS